MEAWLRSSPEGPETVVLDDVIVSAVGSAPLGDDGSLLEGDFLAAIRAHLQERTNAGQIGTGVAPGSYPHFKPQNLANELLAHEAERTGVSERELGVASQICEKMRDPLSAMLGPRAFRTLLVRALALARLENAALETVKVNEDGTLEGDCEASLHAGAVLITHLIKVPSILIGETLTQALIQGVWPELNAPAISCVNLSGTVIPPGLSSAGG